MCHIINIKRERHNILVLKVTAVVPAFNEEEFIGECLNSLINQTLEISPIVVVDDNSTDNTKKIASSLTDHVRLLTSRKVNRFSEMTLAEVYNYGFKYLRENFTDYDFVLVVDGDTILPKDYVRELITHMRGNNWGLASGVIENEEGFRNVRGSGRIMSRELFEKIDFQYPVNYGFDSYPAHMATLHDFGFGVNKELKFRVLRPTSQNYSARTFVYNARGFRAFGYMFLFALWSFIISMIKLKSIKPLIFGIYGYFSLKKSDFYPSELRKSVKGNQRRILKSRIFRK